MSRGVSSTFWLFWAESLGQDDVGHIERWQSNFPPSNPINKCNFPGGWGCVKLDCCRQGLVLVVCLSSSKAAGWSYFPSQRRLCPFLCSNKWRCSCVALHRGASPLLFFIPKACVLIMMEHLWWSVVIQPLSVILFCISYPNLSSFSSASITFFPHSCAFEVKHSHAIRLLPVGKHCRFYWDCGIRSVSITVLMLI